MESIILDGKALAKLIEEDLKLRVMKIVKATGIVPILATILVGDDPASATYVTMKGKACERVGMMSKRIELPKETTTAQLKHEIKRLNEDDDIFGILLQHPVPKDIDERACFDAISVSKDVDGVTALGYGRMAMGEPAYASATPKGIMKLLAHYKIPLAGRIAVVVGRSPILGKPMSALLLNEHATVITAHSRTADLPAVVGLGDIVVGAVGKMELIKGEWIKDGAVVVDAGSHKKEDGTYTGDIDLSGVINRCFAYTPAKGAVGPMTIATLMTQTVEAAERRFGLN